MPHVAAGHEQHAGKQVDNGHCARFIQVAGGVGQTATWRRGVRARGGNLEPGTLIATFGPDGRYTNRVDGTAHCAILIAEQTDGLLVWDQWQGQPVHQRVIRYRGGTNPTNAMNDGDCFHAIELAGNDALPPPEK
jgi:hypothetical protein